MWYQKPFFRNLIVIVLILSAVYLGYTLLPFIDSFSEVVTVVLYPLILTLILYYIFRPLVRLVKEKITVYGGILLVYLILSGITAIFAFLVYPKIVEEIELINSIDIEKYLSFEDIQSSGKDTKFHIEYYLIVEIKKFVINGLPNLHTYIVNKIPYFISTITDLVLTLIITPFMLFYFLKDENLLYNNFITSLPEKFQDKTKTLLHETDQILLHFITARVIISLIINSLLLIAFLIMGVKLVAIIIAISVFFYIIPSVGSIIATFLALLIGFSQSTFVGIEVLITMSIAAGIEGFLVTPQVMGKKLYIHPLTVLIILLGAGYVLGFIGLLFSTPIYVLIKLLFKHFREWRYQKADQA